MKTSPFRRASDLSFATRFVTLAIIAALLAPVILINPGRTVSANPAKIKTEQPAPPAAPPEPFLIAAGDSASTSFMAASIVSVQNFFATAKAPAGLEMAKVPTFGEKVGSYFGSFFGLFTPSAKAAAPAPPPPPPPSAPVHFNFEGADSISDRGRWHPATQEFKVKKSSDGSYLTYTLGTSASAKAAPGDYDGDGDTDAGVFLNGAWKYKTSPGGSEQTVNWGTAGDIPVPGRYDNNTTTDFAVYRPSTGYWWILKSSDWSYYGVALGNSSDIPVVGDYDGDGFSDPAVFRPSNGTWYIQGSSVGYYSAPWGLAVDVPVPADYDGDGITDMAVFRPTTGDWYAYSSDANNGTYINATWGNYGDQPVPGYYNGDARADFAVWRPTTGAWFTMTNEESPNPTTYDYQVLGVPGDQAVPSAYIKQIGSSVTADELNQERLKPKNATGGTDLYSQNFGWSSGLVGLPGRSGLNAGFGMGYNSLIWLKQGSSMIFDPDTSNISPGFRFGFPTIEPVYYSDNLKDTFAYMMVTPSGGRVEFRQTAVSNKYDTADSSYTQLVTTGATNPNDPVEDITIKVTTTDGTQMSYVWKAGAFRCTQIKDRNGNYISNTYDDDYGRLTTVTDTLGRVITVNYDGGGYPTTITQTWKDTNGSGSNLTHTWATFTYTTTQISTDFDGLTVFGPPNGTYIKVLQKVTRSDGTHTDFLYNGYGQVYKVSNIAADNTSHVLNHVRTNLESPAADQTDCPRFTETKSFIENFNSGSEITINNTLTTGQTYSVPADSGTATRIQVWMTGHPDNLRSNTFVGSSGWNEGLPIATEDCLTTTSTCSERKRWTWTEWTQDNTSASYPINPRVVESQVGDGTNTKRSETEYYVYPSTNVSVYGLPKESIVYKSDLSTTEKKVIYGYNLHNDYTINRIIGLPEDTHVYGYDQDPLSSGLKLVSKTSYVYDEGSFGDSDLEQNISPVQHDNTNYSASFTKRGNLTSVKRWDVYASGSPEYAVTSSQKYNTAGSVVSKTDPVGRTVKIGYADSFNSTVSGSTYAYPTKLTDPADIFSTVKYRYDIGANVEAVSPAPNSTTKTSKRIFDSHGRIERNSIYLGGNEHSYVRYVYPNTGIESQTYAPIVDADGDTNIAEDEVLTTSLHDGAGRVRMSRSENPGSSGGFTGQKIEYDILGRIERQSVPTELDSDWDAAGDDLTRGFLWTYQKYDWMGRVVRKINTDGTDSPTANDSDVFISYDGCGCAGGQVTTIQGENIIENNWQDNSAVTKGRKTQKAYADHLGRNFKTETMNWDGSTVYSTVLNTYNGRDQVLNARQYSGTTSSSTHQDTVMEYDGHGRLKTRHLPQQNTGTHLDYNYNADDSVLSITDARGASTNYTYTDLGQVEEVSYTVPTSSPIEVPADVTFTYDDLGNRTAMVDALGRVDYEYNELSQMTAETRDFNDSLFMAPISGSKFKLEYTYSLSGQLKSLKDPFGDQINYAFDKAGRLNTVTGSTSFHGITTYFQSPGYRAWGGLESLSYGNGTTMSVTYNNSLRAINSKMTKTGPDTVMESDYNYYADGSLRKVDDLEDEKFDRLNTYDHMGRPASAKSGLEARGGTPTEIQLNDLPYRHTYSYNAFNNLTDQENFGWGVDHYDPTYTYSNNRITDTSSTFDADGRMLYNAATGFPTDSKYDAAGRLALYHTWLASAREREVGRIYNGDGREEKRTERNYSETEPEVWEWEVEAPRYYIRSTVLGGDVVTDVNSDGVKQRTYVRAGSQVIAWQNGTTAYWGEVVFQHWDASGMSYRTSQGDGTINDSRGYEGAPGELTPMGGNVGNEGPVTVIPGCPGCELINENMPMHYDPWGQKFTMDGLPINAEEAHNALAAGRAARVVQDDRGRDVTLGVGVNLGLGLFVLPGSIGEDAVPPGAPEDGRGYATYDRYLYFSDKPIIDAGMYHKPGRARNFAIERQDDFDALKRWLSECIKDLYGEAGIKFDDFSETRTSNATLGRDRLPKSWGWTSIYVKGDLRTIYNNNTSVTARRMSEDVANAEKQPLRTIDVMGMTNDKSPYYNFTASDRDLYPDRGHHPTLRSALGGNISTQIHELGNSLGAIAFNSSTVDNGPGVDGDWGYRLGSCVELKLSGYLFKLRNPPPVGL